MSVGLFADVYSLAIGTRPAKLNYGKLKEKAEEYGEVTRCQAYGHQHGSEAEPFIKSLSYLGYKVHYKHITIGIKNDKKSVHADVLVPITLEIMQLYKKLETIVIASNNPSFEPLVEFLDKQGIKVVVIGNMNAPLVIPISEDMLLAPRS